MTCAVMGCMVIVSLVIGCCLVRWEKVVYVERHREVIGVQVWIVALSFVIVGCCG